ncbi:LRR receptor-like serine threonine-protein kinase At4g08850-like [Seminavis robusta]|uniref:LRR receptor-like serine threonine-protein kinase At4g08850-like n=1 Tax=Seminavis robusta TaxID=568900 RepID=A0A9N8EYX5_9STRA|nr:LRR receptor-like serine threonine-protein kinase At4g08850-like [Seminavis robusta]|eukprot:Sro2487_g329060.1 LRR receptor-like serine threonine-protein kinase At4g08850-like (999) ;mRNA; f:9250-12879
MSSTGGNGAGTGGSGPPRLPPRKNSGSRSKIGRQTQPQRSRSGPRPFTTSAGRGTSHSPAPPTDRSIASGDRRRFVPSRSKSAEGAGFKWVRGASSRRMTAAEEQDFELETAALEKSSRGSTRFNRTAVATAANTTMTTEKREKRRSSMGHSSLADLSGGGGGAGAGADFVNLMEDSMVDLGTSSHTRDSVSQQAAKEESESSLFSPPSSALSLLGTSGRGQSSAASLRSKHKTTVALRFLEDQDQEGDFDLSPGGGFPTQPAASANSNAALNNNPSMMNKSVADFHMSQLNFPTIASGGKGGIFDDESLREENTRQSRFRKKANEISSIPETNVFTTRQDLREVDQSVNLMDVETGKYEPRRKNRRGKSSTRMSMVDVFLGESHNTSDVFSSVGLMKKRGNQKGYGGKSCWDRCVDCCSAIFKVVCSLPVLIFVAVLSAGLIGIPMYLEYQENHPPAPAPIETPAPVAVETPAPTEVPVTDAPVAVPAPQPETTATSAGTATSGTTTTTAEANLADALFPAAQVERRVAAVENFLNKAGVDVDVSVPSMVQAITWLAAYDPAMLVLSSAIQNEVVQRVAMAGFYYATHPKEFANTTGVSPLSGQRFLSNNNNIWMSQKNICEWQGLECDNDDLVIHLNMSRHDLHGTLPDSLTLLTDLVELDLSRNLLEGTLPVSWTTAFPKLEYLWLHDNQLTGELPESVGELGDSVFHLDLSENQFSGKLPTSLGQLSATRLLYLHKNKFHGKIPVELGHLPKIEYLYLGNNELSGEVPMDLLAKIATVKDLRLNDNGGLSGTVPPEIESLHRLEFLSLAGNKMHGQLPDVFERLHYLVDLDVSNNKISGSLPASIGKATLLENLRLEHNEIGSTIPATWLTLTNLVTLALHNNKLKGPIPQSISDMVKLKDLLLNNNPLTGTIPQQLGQLKHIVNVSLHETDLTGELPSSFQDLYTLESLRMQKTKLTGEVPAEVCLLKYEHKLDYIASDCSSGIDCECCSECF